ncbi:MAG: methyltransferase domain-containing protein [Elusimicrobiota bacterium]
MIQTEKIEECILCGNKGKVLYKNLEDRLFGAPGKYGFLKCLKCNLIWLNPCAIKEDIPKCYLNYFTHSLPEDSPQFNKKRFLAPLRDLIRNLILSETMGYRQFKINKWWAPLLGKILSRIPILRFGAGFGRGVLFPPFIGEGRLLEVGCGNGGYLKFMQNLGWKVLGIDIDAEALKIAKEKFNLSVILGSLEEIKFPENSFDIIATFHVIEHIPNPITFLKECYRILKPKGRLIISTPNAESLAHKIFKENCRILEPPRHFYLYSLFHLKKLLKNFGFKILHLSTTSNIANFIYQSSIQIKKFGKVDLNRKFNHSAFLFEKLEMILLIFFKNIGEEIRIIATKNYKVF